ncbi:MAG: NAD(P)/FAD-dependent oxidoreductase [Acidobacteria bacterium]|nr:NAD(P)/FAD-dependent oxidoreductase [Acidobacteriota bacterium]MCA1650240.1 NAD(P)/FAD-dependent oxidoreductase [Acidobacteriota bacterium]
MSVPHVVILGGGFGGLYAARALKRERVAVTVVDRRNHHLFQPLLYQVAMAALSPGDIASPIRWIVRKQRNVDVLLGDVRQIDTTARLVRLEDGSDIPYDFLIVATGTTHAYFGHDEWRTLAPGLKTLDDALEIRRRVLLAFERAERENDLARRRALLTFVVIGGGPTGVEMAGALAEIAKKSLARDFRHIDPRSSRIVLVEAGQTLLAAFPASLRAAAQRDLERLGVELRFGSPVTAVHPGRVETGGEWLHAETVIWAAGVAASPVGATLGVRLDRAGRVLVTPELCVPGHPDVFVVGDLAALNGADGKPLPGVAQVAIQMGQHAVRNILRAIERQPLRPFVYRDLGNMATIGRASAVADLGRVRLTGYVAWLAWLFVHLLNLIGFRNRLVVMLQWAWAYFSYQRAVRLITGSDRPT